MRKIILFTLTLFLFGISTAYAELSWKNTKDTEIYGLKLGNKYTNNLGKPDKILKDNNIGYYYKGLIITTDSENFIRSISIKSPKYKTYRGIKVTDTKEKVINMYGEPYIERNNKGKLILLYQSDEKVGQVYYLNFYIIKGKIRKISIHSEFIW